MTRLLLVGATGLVGQSVLAQVLADPRVEQLVAPTRRALPAHPKLLNPVVDFEALPDDAAWWSVNAVVCALGTTIKIAGSQAAFYRVDHDLPLEVARRALQHGASSFALNSALGASAASPVFYSRTKGELERDLRALGYASLTLVRPGLIGGERQASRPAERLAIGVTRVLQPVLPRRWHVVPADRIAAHLLAAALAGWPGVRVLESGELLDPVPGPPA
jgi:uncharacterized protein YbjT (DUF2867 family)